MCRSVLALLIALAMACRPSDTSVGADVAAYYSRTQTWAAMDAEAARTIERILATQFVDEAEVRRQIADARPRAVAHRATIRGYSPRTPTVVRVHARYLVAWDELVRAFDDIERGFDSGDFTLLARGREGMAQWKEGVLAVARDLRRLIEQYDVELTRPLPS